MIQNISNVLNEAVKSPWIKFTEYFILGVIALIIVVDIILATNGHPEDTISEVIIKEAHGKFSVLTWLWGVLAGHLFLARSVPLLGRPNSIYLLIALTFLILIAGLFTSENLVIQVILLLIGGLAGYLLWPQQL